MEHSKCYRMRFLSPKMYDVPPKRLPLGEFCTELMLDLPSDPLTILTIIICFFVVCLGSSQCPAVLLALPECRHGQKVGANSFFCYASRKFTANVTWQFCKWLGNVLLQCSLTRLSKIDIRPKMRLDRWMKNVRDSTRSPLQGACNSHILIANATAFLRTSLFLDILPAK